MILNTIKVVKRKAPVYNIELRGLNERHRRFCEEYIYDWNASRAYRVAYPNVKSITAGTNGNQLLKNTIIKAYVEEVQKDIAKYVGISRARIAREYMKLAFNTIADLHNNWITRKEFSDLTADQKACISEIQTKVTKRNVGTNDEPIILDVEEIKIKLYDKKGALDSLTRFFGYAEPEKIIGQFEHNVTINEIKTDGLSKPARELLLEISKKQLTDGVTNN